MSETIPNSGHAIESWAPFERVKRMEQLKGSQGGQWLLKKIDDELTTLKRMATTPALTESERLARSIAADLCAEVEKISRWVPEEFDSAVKLLNEAERKEKPGALKQEPEL